MATTAPPHPRLWTRKEYYRLAEKGLFHPDERLELIEGVIYKKPRQSPPHAVGICLLGRTLIPLFMEGHYVRQQFPLVLGDYTEPEPDIAVVPGKIGDYLEDHPTFAVLVVEVADVSLLHDRECKTSLYARAGIPEYWILNLVDWLLEVHRNPKDGAYSTRLILRDGDTVSPLSRPEASIPVAGLLPRK
jgi:Uma2 family endonuclease